MFAGNASQQILQFVTFIVLARQLAPEIFGQVALASVVTDIAGAIAIWGLPGFLIQRGILNNKLQAHVFTLAILVSVVISLLIGIGVGIYAFVDEYTLIAQLILLQTPLLLIQAIGVVPDVIVRRNLEFKWLAIRNNVAALLGGCTGLTLAYMDMGVYALVAQKLVAITVLSVTVWIVARKEMFFLKLSSLKWSTMVLITRQSLRLLSNHISTLICLRAMDAIIGLSLGNTVLGQFKIVMRIYDLLVQLALAPLSSVSFAAFPKVLSNKEELRRLYNNLITFSLIIFVPVMTGVAVTADNWVPLVLGEKWLEVVPLLAILSITAVQCILGTFQNSLQMSLRWNHFILKQNFARLIISVLLTLIAAQFNIYLILVFHAVQAYGLAMYNAYAINKQLNWPWSDLLRAVAPSLAPTLIMLAVLLVMERFVQGSSLEMLILDVAVGMMVYTASFLLLFSSKVKTLLQMLKQRKVGPAL